MLYVASREKAKVGKHSSLPVYLDLLILQMTFSHLFIYFYVYLFILIGRKNRGGTEKERERKREKERILSRLCTVSVNPDTELGAGLEPVNCEIMT